MAENLPINFPIPSESAIASYDYIDIINGMGTAEFYWGFIYVDTTLKGVISDHIFLSARRSLATNSASAQTVVFNSSPFKNSRIIPKNALVTVQGMRKGAIVPGNLVVIGYTLEVVRAAGGTDSIFTSTAVSAYVGESGFTQGEVMANNFTINRGDYLKMTLTYRRGGDSGQISVGTDPTGVYPSKISIPFKIDL